MKEKVKVKIYYLLSFFKKKWSLSDYPIKKYINENDKGADIIYGARIINWNGLVGFGLSPDEAYTELECRFNLYKKNNVSIPRPGVRKELEFVSKNNINKFEHIAIDFFNKILNMDYRKGFYSDESYLLLFCKDKECENMIISKIKEIYDVDMENLLEIPLWVVLKQISDTQ